jgi:hypothetical protein
MSLSHSPLPDPPVPAAAVAVAAPSAWRLAVVALPQIAALAIMLQTETDLLSRLSFLLTWGLLNFLLLVLLRRPATAGLVALGLVTVLILLSRLKHEVVQMTANFIDLMVIDNDTTAFLFTIYPNLRWGVLAGAAVGLPLVYLTWRVDPFRLRRLSAAVGALACLLSLTALARTWPDEAWRAYYDDGYVSKFARSGVGAVADFIHHGWLEADAEASPPLKMPLVDSCTPATRRPHIVLIHDESSFDLRSAPGVKVPPGYGSHFKSFDGRIRSFLAESSGGPSWFTEYNVLAGLSARSFGPFSYFVTRLAAGRVERGLPLALRRCGYATYSLYPARGGFMGARQFQQSTGMQRFFDAPALGARGVEPDRFFYDHATALLTEAKAGKAGAPPVFMYVYLAANHFPWDVRYRPELTPGWQGPGNVASVDEYLRRQQMSEQDYRAFVAGLRKRFPGEPFLIVRYGDHQPEFAPDLLSPQLGAAELGARLMSYDPRYFATYYAIDAINFQPAKSAAIMDTIDGPYLPLVVQEAAGLPLDPSFEEQKAIMLRCSGLFYACGNGAEARRFNRLLIDAGYIKGM